MNRIFELNTKTALIIFIIADLLCVAMGMGVPIFCIMFGFPVGWYIARKATIDSKSTKDILRKVLVHAIVTSTFTLLVMSIVWGPTIQMLFNPNSDFKNFGIPMILYGPKMSFVGWIILMILISPFLQLLATIFTSYLTLLKLLNSHSNST